MRGWQAGPRRNISGASGFLPGCALEHLSKCSPTLFWLRKSHVLQEAHSQLEEGIQGPGSPQEPSLASVLRYTYSCHEHCLRIWFGPSPWQDLRPGPRVPRWLADIRAVCLSPHAPGVGGWQEGLCCRSFLHIFTKGAS